jgi:hypothetical protein
MPAMTAPDDRDTVTLQLTPAELELVRVGLRFVLSTLGREEADELEEVRDLLGRLPPPRPAPRSSPGGGTGGR